MNTAPSQRLRILPLNSGIGDSNFLCCLSGIFTFSIIHPDCLHGCYFEAEMFYLLTSCSFCCLLCSTRLENAYVILCLKEQIFFNLNNTNVFCATLFCIWMFLFFPWNSWFFLVCNMFVGSHPHRYLQPLFVSGLLNRLRSIWVDISPSNQRKAPDCFWSSCS